MSQPSVTAELRALLASSWPMSSAGAPAVHSEKPCSERCCPGQRGHPCTQPLWAPFSWPQGGLMRLLFQHIGWGTHSPHNLPHIQPRAEGANPSRKSNQHPNFHRNGHRHATNAPIPVSSQPAFSSQWDFIPRPWSHRALGSHVRESQPWVTSSTPPSSEAASEGPAHRKRLSSLPKWLAFSSLVSLLFSDRSVARVGTA